MLSLGYSVRSGHGTDLRPHAWTVPLVVMADILGSRRLKTPLTQSPFHLQIIKEVPPPPVEESEVGGQSRVLGVGRWQNGANWPVIWPPAEQGWAPLPVKGTFGPSLARVNKT